MQQIEGSVASAIFSSCEATADEGYVLVLCDYSNVTAVLAGILFSSLPPAARFVGSKFVHFLLLLWYCCHPVCYNEHDTRPPQRMWCLHTPPRDVFELGGEHTSYPVKV